MPRATNNIEDLVHKDLKTCEGGYVKLRSMTYGQFLARQQMSMDMQMEMAGKGNNATRKIDLDMATKKVAEFEFGICVAEHNLEDHTGRMLDFRNPVDVQLLDPRIGQEIGQYINELNVFEDESGN